ncbi:c-type cytochrome [Marinicellulosiphila megalodicopiae]|uniref:c-type cytochrome n=1 Tax=Marinicellulosiphila megalodicopiae TaxID=2724896 RepID=UPI003BB06D22
MLIKHLSLLLMIGFASISCQTQPEQDQTKVDPTIAQAKLIESIIITEFADQHPGYDLFLKNGCPVCHDKDLSGTKMGPPLIFSLYKNGHHNNERLFKSIKEGVAQHHWYFGNMPAFAHISDTDINLMVTFIRQSLELNKIK